MSTPRFNGGERHSEGMESRIRKVPRSAALAFYGRLAAALAAGCVFAMLAYQSPASAKREATNVIQAADRQDAVTEDGVLPLLDERRARVATEDAVGLVRPKNRDSSRMANDGAGDLPSDGRGRSLTRADQDDELGRHTTAAPHSRGPPGE
ncbi:MAG TPA: hypothetical protein VJZ71_10625 [Phycisphaerae bacterium]|nr:hypothetical protein [Phycisphaerae bacterium]